MPTLMRQETFDSLAGTRKSLTGSLEPLSTNGKLAGICVPWAGHRLKKEGGIYLVGMATDGDYWAAESQTYEHRLAIAQSLCSNRHGRSHSPFWQFLDGLTWGLLGAPFDRCSDSWGWSNLLKIGWSTGNPNQWRPPIAPRLINEQREACIASLREEFGSLRNSVIVIASCITFGVLEDLNLFPKLIPNWQENYELNWNKEHHEETGVYSFVDHISHNLYVHCYHPGHMVRAWDSCWGSAIGRIIHLAGRMPTFASSTAQ